MAVQRADMHNGCLQVVPGSQKEVIPLGSDRCITEKWCKEREGDWVPVELETGEWVVGGRKGGETPIFKLGRIGEDEGAGSEGGKKKLMDGPSLHDR